MPTIPETSSFKPEDFIEDVSFLDELHLSVASSRPGHQAHVVTHDFVSPLDCTCEHYSFKQFCKSHWAKVQIVLDNRSARREREKRQREQRKQQREYEEPLHNTRLNPHPSFGLLKS